MGYSLFACVNVICFGVVLWGHVSGYSNSDYALYFPKKGKTDYANIWGMPKLTKFTICLWMKTTEKTKGTLLSYAVPGQVDELNILYDDKGFSLVIGGKSSKIKDIFANDGDWHQICVSWQNSDGAWQFFKDGALLKHDKGLQKGHIIKGGGSLVLGQHQDSLGAGFQEKQAFQGILTKVDVWSYVSTPKAIYLLSRSCMLGEGNVYMWSDFINGVKGATALIIPSPCKGQFPGGHPPAGHKPGTQKPGSHKPGGEKPTSHPPTSHKTESHKPTGRKPENHKPGNQKPVGNIPGGKKPGGQKPAGQKPGGQKPAGQKPGGQNPGVGAQHVGGQNPGFQYVVAQNSGGQNPGGQIPGGQNPVAQNPGGQIHGGQNPGVQYSGGQNLVGQNPGGQHLRIG